MSGGGTFDERQYRDLSEFLHKRGPDSIYDYLKISYEETLKVIEAKNATAAALRARCEALEAERENPVNDALLAMVLEWREVEKHEAVIHLTTGVRSTEKSERLLREVRILADKTADALAGR